jgi:methionyl-tRNA synthetase
VSKTYSITTPIYYVNDVPHLGHTYTTVACDVMARFKRLDGFDVYFLTGTDEHGQKVKQSADKLGITPQALTDKVSQNFRDLAHDINASNDDFIRTTEDRHEVACQTLWKKLVQSGDIYLGKHAGWYAVRDEAYYNDDELRDVDGKKIAPSGAECTWMEEENYMFRLSAWGDRLLKYYDDHPDFIQPEARRNEVISFVKSGLRDLSVSRTIFDWGVPVPDAPKHVMYVWIDALTNYITALGYPDINAEKFKKFWPADLHMVGKDIIRFHTVYWPAFLMSAGLLPPKRVFAHGWWTVEGVKMSKSLGNVLSPYDLMKTYTLDGMRYALLGLFPFGNDGDFSAELAKQKINNHLANGLGNLAQRTLSFVAKNAGAAVPSIGTLNADDQKLLKAAQTDMLVAVRDALDHQKYDRAFETIFAVVNDANIYIDTQAPWTLKKNNQPDRMNTVLYVLCETLRCLGLILQPFVPDTAGKLLDQLAVDKSVRDFGYLCGQYALKPGTPLPEPVGIFPRLMDDNAAQK